MTPKYLFTGTLQSGDEVAFYSDRTWREGGMTGEWDIRADGTLAIRDWPTEPFEAAVFELQFSYDQWKIKMKRVVNDIILADP